MDYYVNVEKHFRQNNPYYLDVSPQFNATNLIPNQPLGDVIRTGPGQLQIRDLNYIYITAASIRRAASEMVRATGLLWGAERIGGVTGRFFITNLINQAQAYEPRQPFLVRHITYEALLALFARISQSNETLTVFDVKWTFVFDARSIAAGNAAMKIPSWVRPSDQITWKNHFHEFRQLNCAAFALALMTNPNVALPVVYQKAADLMDKYGWDRDVTIDEVLNIVPDEFPDYRVSILIAAYSKHSSRTIAGPNYQYETTGNNSKLTANCAAKTIYLVYDYEHRHYAVVKSPNKFFSTVQAPARKFCSRCVSTFAATNQCSCEDDVRYRKREKVSVKKCQFCGRVKCKGKLLINLRRWLF